MMVTYVFPFCIYVFPILQCCQRIFRLRGTTLTSVTEVPGLTARFDPHPKKVINSRAHDVMTHIELPQVNVGLDNVS
jgi:hypothetical protein